jgi:hypothetical protein
MKFYSNADKFDSPKEIAPGKNEYCSVKKIAIDARRNHMSQA